MIFGTEPWIYSKKEGQSEAYLGYFAPGRQNTPIAIGSGERKKPEKEITSVKGK